MKRSLYLVIFLCIGAIPGSASHQTLDSIRIALKSKPKFVLGFNNRLSYVGVEASRTSKLYVGLDYDRIIRFELAYNAMPKAAVETDYLVHGDTLVRTNQMSYLGLQAEYTFFRNRRWKLSLPVQVGIGGNQNTRRLNSDLQFSGKSTVLPVEPGVNALYYFYDWLGAKAGVGYRLTFGQSLSSLSGSYYNLGVAIFAGELYQKFKDRDW
jgi:hypothetical protein